MRAADFTTYINAIEDPQLDRKFDRLAARGARAFDTIAASANHASAAAAGLLQGRGTGGLGGQTRQITQQATATRDLARSTTEAGRAEAGRAAATRVGTAASVTSAAAHRAQATAAAASTTTTAASGAAAANSARQHMALARSLNATSTALNVVQGPLGPLAGRVGAASRALSSLTGFQLGGAAAGALAFTVARLGNEYQQLEGRLRPYLSTQRQVNSAMRDIQVIAQDSRAALEPVADLYTKLTAMSERYGVSQARVARITRVASQAATLSGGSEQSRAAGLYQFSQGLSSNRLGGDELRSILENTPALAQAIADGLGVTTGALREMGAQGKLTAQQIMGALERAAGTVEDKFNKLPPTLATAGTLLRNSLVTVVGEFDKAVGLSSGLAQVLMAIANNLREILSVAIGVGAAFAIMFATRRIGQFIAGVVQANIQQIRMARLAGEIAVATRVQAQAEAAGAAQRSIAAAADARNATSRRIAIQQNIAAMAAERRQIQANIAAARVGAGPLGRLGSTAYRAALIQERELTRQLSIATADLTRAKAGETVAKNANTAATNANAIAQGRLTGVTRAGTAATAASAAGTGFAGRMLRFAGGGAGIFGFALTALTFGLLTYTSTQDAANEATERARQVMEDYASIVDQATGKVRALTEEEGRRTRARAEEAIQDFEGPGGNGNRLRRQIAAQARAAASFAPTPTGLPTPMSVGAGANAYDFAGNFKQAIPGQPYFDQTYRDRLLSSQYAEQFRRYEDLHRLAGQLESGPGGYTQAIDEINRRAAAGDQVFVRLRNNIRGTADEVQDLRASEQQARRNIDILDGGTDPQWQERQAQEEARLNSSMARTEREQRRRIAEEDTRNDTARYNRNLREQYETAAQQAGVPGFSPEDIATLRENRAALTRQPIPAGQENLRADALRALDAQIETAVRRNNQYKGTIESLARAQTQAQTAERDQNREIAQTNQQRREAIEIAKDAAAAALNAGLLELEQKRITIGEREYVRQRQVLLATYDEEINKLDERQSSSSRGITALIADTRRQVQEFQRFDERRSEILGRYTDEPKAVQRAARDIRVLAEGQQTLGEGFYPREVMEADVRRIREGLQKPFREIIRENERQREIQLLLIQARETEARVLERIHQLVEAGNDVSADQHRTLLENADAQQRINDILERRDRLMSLLQGSVDATRDSLEDFLTAVRDASPEAAGDAIKGIVRRFSQIQIRQLVERVTSGLDDDVRALLSGRNAAEYATRTFSAQVSSTGQEIVTLGEASRTASSAMVESAQAIRDAVRNGLATPGAEGSTAGTGGGSAPAGSTLSTWQNSGSGPAAVGARPVAQAAAEATTTRFVTAVQRMLQPLDLGGRQARVSSGFGSRTHPVTGQRGSFHPGIDLPAPEGTRVRAAYAGRVTQAGPRYAGDPLGNAVFVDHGNGLRTIYGHLSRISVRLGQIVQRGDTLGGVGSTGRSTGNHLHFGVQRQGANGRWSAINPGSADALEHTVRIATTAATGAAVRESRKSAQETTAKTVEGLLQAGNIDLDARPRVQNADGSISTLSSISIGTEIGEVLIPTIDALGRRLTDQEAVDQYNRTGEHLGVFDTPQNATRYAEELSARQGEVYTRIMSPEMQRVATAVEGLTAEIQQNGAAGITPAAAPRSIDIGPGGDLGGLQTLDGSPGTPDAIPTPPADPFTSMRDDALARMRGVTTANFMAGGGRGIGYDIVERLVNNPDFQEARARQERSGQYTRPRELYNEIGRSVGKELDGLFGTGRFFTRIGKSFGTALEGAGKGAIASGFASALGIKQSGTGAQIGGALGQLAAPMLGPLAPFAPFIGGLLGGTIGGLLGGTKKGSATIGMGDFGGLTVTGTTGKSSLADQARGTAGGIISTLEDIARQLGGTVGNFGGLSVGVRGDRFRVDPSGRGQTKGKGVLDFASEQEAVAKALEIAISRGAITGISAASQNILRSTQDLNQRIEKAALIESIPKRLMQRTNPVLFAVTELNREFLYMIQVLKEAGATGEQFAQAQQLYELERAEAIKQAAESMFGAIDDYLKEMTSGQSSPLNKRTVFENAQTELNKFVADINAGKTVDQTDLLAAAKNFQDASRGLKGSSEGFFTDFDFLFNLLTKARNNAAGLVGTEDPTNPANLPPSPFASDPAVQAMIDAYRGTQTAVETQTDVLAGLLQQIVDGIYGGGSGTTVGDMIHVLPGLGGGGGGGRYQNMEAV